MPRFFDDNQYKAFASLVGVPGADNLDSRFSVLGNDGTYGGVVSAESFGAKPDGITDSTSAVNAAIAALGGKGIVEFGDGTYILQGVNIVEGVYFKGKGARKAQGGPAATRLRMPASPAAGVSMFRVPCEVTTASGFTDLLCTVANSTNIITTTTNHGWSAGQPVRFYRKYGPIPAGVTETTVYYAGEAVNSAGLSGNTLRLYGTQAQARTGGSTGVTDFTTDGFIFTAATTDVCTSLNHPFKPGDAVQVASTGTLPSNLVAGTTYYVGRPSGTSFFLYTTSGNAITGGTPIDLDAGSGTHTIWSTTGAYHGIRSASDPVDFYGGGIMDCELDGRANSGSLTKPTALQSSQSVGIDFSAVNTLYDWHIERCYFHNWDVAYKDAFLGNIGLYIANSEARYNFCAFNVNEQPMMVMNTINNNAYAIAGRLVDATIQSQYMGNNDVCIGGYLEFTGRWAGNNSAAANASVTNCVIGGCFFYQPAIVGLACTGNNTIIGNSFVGASTDTASDGSTGIRLQGDGNNISGNLFGEGSAGSSFYRCGILLDACSGSNIVDTLIQGNTFYLTTCPAIQGGNSQTGIYGSGAYGSIAQVSVLNNTFRMLSHRAIDMRTTTGTAQYWHISGNRITNLPSGSAGGTAALATTDALIEGAFRYYTLSNNYFHKNGGLSTARGFTSSWAAAQSGQIINNRFEAWTSTNQNVNIAAGGGDALTQLALNWYTGGGASIGATDNTIKADNIGP
jgi:hypothetical protein